MLQNRFDFSELVLLSIPENPLDFFYQDDNSGYFTKTYGFESAQLINTGGKIDSNILTKED